MDPMTIMAIASSISAATGVGGMLKKQPGQYMFPEAIKVGAKPPMQVGNPYQTPIATTGQDPYGQMMNPMMRRQPMFSSAIGRYGGFG